MLQHGAYRQLLDHCWDQRGPVPLDLEKCYRICGAVSKEEQDAVRSIISEFFIQMQDGHYNRRMQKEVERANAISNERSKAGRNGGLAKAKQLPSKSQAKAKQLPLTPTTTITTTTTTNTRNTGAARFVSFDDLVAEGVNEQHAQDWLRVRKTKLTPTAWEGIKREASKASIAISGVVQIMAERSWQSFKADWAFDKKPIHAHSVIDNNVSTIKEFFAK